MITSVQLVNKTMESLSSLVPNKKNNNKKSKESNRPEHIMYWWKDPVEKFKGNVCYIMNGKALHPEDIEFVNVVNSDNHGNFDLDLPLNSL